MAAYIVSIDKCCLIPIKEISGKSLTLRTNKPLNNQKEKVHYVSDFDIEKVLCVETLHGDPKS